MNPPEPWPEETLTFVRRRHEYNDVATYVFKPAHPVQFTAGQYGHVRLFGLPPEEKQVREFSFASAPHDEEIWFGVDSRSESAYQQRLKDLHPGDMAGLFKIKGHMTWPPVDVSKVVMIAGGIGVTPFRSMLRDQRERNIPVHTTLIQVSGEHFLYGEELSELSESYFSLSRDEFSKKLTSLIREEPDAHYYLAGSPGFVRDSAATLLRAGITAVESDEFKGLTE